MKKLLLIILALLLVLTGFVLVRTWLFAPIEYSGELEVFDAGANPRVLQGALTFETISHKPEMIDDSAFTGFHHYLEETFPKLHQTLEKETVSGYSLIYTWHGRNSGLKPLVLMAHQDVVPVEYSSRDQWEAGPFDGQVKDGFIYGRGTLDDKGSLIAIMQAVESLLEEGFQPERTIYLCFGHDEEISGENGARKIAESLEHRGVKAWMVLDEGGTLSDGLVPGIEQIVALIGISEKGYMSVELSVDMPGGHSSMPEKRNAITVLNEAVHKLVENPMPDRISPPIQGFIEHVGPNLPFIQKMAFANTAIFKPLIFSVYNQSASGAALVHTTQVPTIINSGIKDNIVPTRAKAVINYRLLPGDTPDDILKRINETIDDQAVKATVYEEFAIPASPISDYRTDAFTYLAEVISSVNKDAIVSPYLVLGATDGRYFYNVSPNVYRFSPFPIAKDDLPRIHGINERVSVESFKRSVNFYGTLIRNQ